MLEALLGFVPLAIVILLILGVIYLSIRRLYHRVPPNQVMVVYGRGRTVYGEGGVMDSVGDIFLYWGHASAPDWLAAQIADGTFISTYARDFPDREDIAESFLPYLAVRYRSERISQALADTILQTIPNRIAYFDNQSFDMYPIEENIPTATPDPSPTPTPTPSFTPEHSTYLPIVMK